MYICKLFIFVYNLIFFRMLDIIINLNKNKLFRYLEFINVKIKIILIMFLFYGYVQYFEECVNVNEVLVF